MSSAYKLAESEAQFQGRVQEYATLRGWSWMHIQKAQNAAGYWRTPVTGNLGKGWPDLFMVRGKRIVAAELKGDRTPISRWQQAVLDALIRVPGVEVFIWRPDDWDDVMEVLK